MFSFGDIAGTASGLYAFIQLAGGAVTSLLLSLIQETSFLLGLFFFVTGARKVRHEIYTSSPQKMGSIHPF